MVESTAGAAPSAAAAEMMQVAKASDKTRARLVKLQHGSTTRTDPISFFIFINYALFF